MSNPDYKGHKNLAEMIEGHIHAWEKGLICEKEHALLRYDSDDASYWEHELKALQEIKTAALAELRG